MKRVLKLLIVLVLLYFAFQTVVRFFSKTSVSEYTLTTDGNEITVEEIFTNKVKNEFDNYYFKITVDGETFDFQTLQGFYRKTSIIENVYYFKGDKYTCILPVFTGDRIVSDVLCRDESTYYNYRDIENSEVSTFVDDLEKVGYDPDRYKDNFESVKELDKLSVYNSIADNQFYTVENYSGIFVFGSLRNDYIYDTSIFKSDIYLKDLSAFVGKYYVIADYSEESKFSKFIVIDTVTNKSETISFDKRIDFNSYVQGVVDNSIYIYDKANKIQYEFDLDKEIVRQVGSNKDGLVSYVNGEYVNVKLDENLKFNKYSTDNIFNGKKYYKVDKVGIEVSGFYYIYIKTNGGYKVYRSNIQNKENMTYLFTTDNIDNVVYNEDYVLYQDGSYIKRYSDSEGIRTICDYSELKFNDTLKFNMYVK